MANGEIIQEIRVMLAQGKEAAIPAEVRDRLMLAAIADLYGMVKEKAATKAELENERDCLQTGIDVCKNDVKKLESRVDKWGAGNSLLGAIAIGLAAWWKGG